MIILYLPFFSVALAISYPFAPETFFHFRFHFFLEVSLILLICTLDKELSCGLSAYVEPDNVAAYSVSAEYTSAGAAVQSIIAQKIEVIIEYNCNLNHSFQLHQFTTFEIF